MVNLEVVDICSGLAKKMKKSEKEKNNNLLKAQRILNIKMSAKGVKFFTFSLPGGRLAPLPPSVKPKPARQCRFAVSFIRKKALVSFRCYLLVRRQQLRPLFHLACRRPHR